MCNRYTLTLCGANDWLSELIEEAKTSQTDPVSLTERPLGDVHPTDTAIALIGEFGRVSAVGMRWGFKGEFGLVFNARSETAYTKPMFRDAARERRCALPATGYYEWNERKERYLFRPQEGGVVYLAGLYRTSQDGLKEFCILTREAYGEAKTVHDRMPLIITDLGGWLFDRDAASGMLATGGEVRLGMERQSPHQISMFD